jgi:hydrogenase maturation protease
MPRDTRILVIGYGNELRGDDSAGAALARAIEQRQFPGVEVRIVQQLTPDLSESISAVEAVVFIDAAVNAPVQVRIGQVAPAPLRPGIGHAGRPEELLACAQALFGKSPAAWWIQLPAFALGFGTSLSVAAETGVREGIEAFRQLHARLRSGGGLGGGGQGCVVFAEGAQGQELGQQHQAGAEEERCARQVNRRR